MCLELGFTQKKVVSLPKEVNLRVKNRYWFSLTGLNATSLRVLQKQVRLLRPPNAYTDRGVLLNEEKISLKQGKTTQH